MTSTKTTTVKNWLQYRVIMSAGPPMKTMFQADRIILFAETSSKHAVITYQISETQVKSYTLCESFEQVYGDLFSQSAEYRP